MIRDTVGLAVVGYLLHQLQINSTHLEHHHTFLSHCLDKDIVPKGLRFYKNVHLRKNR